MNPGNLANIQRTHDVADGLTSVKYALFGSDSRFITALYFDFLSSRLILRAEPNFDEVIVHNDLFKLEPGESSVDVSHQSPWKNALGRKPQWIWLLANNQGYNDGVRIEFTGSDAASGLIVDLVVVASQFKLAVAVPMMTEQNEDNEAAAHLDLKP